jgi:hypothetical protein
LVEVSVSRVRAFAPLVAGALVASISALPSPAVAAVTVSDQPGGGCVDPTGHSMARPGPGMAKDRDHLTRAEARALDRRLDRRMERRANQRESAQVQRGQVVVDVVIHEVQDSDRTGKISDATWDAQISELNQDFAGGESATAADTGFRFDLRTVREHVNSTWFNGSDKPGIERKMKKATRVGGYDVLNVWSVNTALLGYAYYPSNGDEGQIKVDGIVINYGSVPGGYIKHYNKGKTLTHEAGHWLGLAHTFERGCNPVNDRVGDTPAQSSPTFGCPTGRDSCDRPGIDPIHNYMDYSYDPCYNQFTTGQAVRMADMWAAFRA